MAALRADLAWVEEEKSQLEMSLSRRITDVGEREMNARDSNICVSGFPLGMRGGSLNIRSLQVMRSRKPKPVHRVDQTGCAKLIHRRIRTIVLV